MPSNKIVKFFSMVMTRKWKQENVRHKNNFLSAA